MLISVITVVYNRSSVVGTAIKSVQSQSYVNHEHIIQDGGSTDGTLDIISSLANSKTFVESGPDDGIYDAINRGIHRCKGDVIGLMHSDDEFADRYVLERVANVMEDSSVDGLYGDLVYVSNDGSDRIVRYWRAGDFDIEKIPYGWMPPHPTLYLRREVFEKFGVYDKTMRISADYEAMIRWLVQHKINLKYIPELLVRMRVGGASNGAIRSIVRKSWEDFCVIRRYNVGGVGTLVSKNLRKAHQFFAKPQG